MEQKNKTFVIRKSMYIMLFLFFIGIIGDIITTLMNINKHKTIEFESNPAFVLGVPLWLLMLFTLFVFFFLLRTYLKRYYSFEIYFRYFLTYALVFLILLKFSFIATNLKALNYETTDIVPIPKDERIDSYKEEVLDLKIAKNLAPKKFKIPLAASMFFWNFFIFILFIDFEKGFIDGEVRNIF